jgi:hypothetical protein
MTSPRWANFRQILLATLFTLLNNICSSYTPRLYCRSLVVRDAEVNEQIQTFGILSMGTASDRKTRN